MQVVGVGGVAAEVEEFRRESGAVRRAARHSERLAAGLGAGVRHEGGVAGAAAGAEELE
ncbi:hypothetical protein AB0L14_30850 [Streptomyces sp. NPDC052727]|uniref:hypothetical protein n=1 Tax=Streptomyces sp. NPDC052727 TaxID=3154854 RepID=UPI00341E188D